VTFTPGVGAVFLGYRTEQSPNAPVLVIYSRKASRSLSDLSVYSCDYAYIFYVLGPLVRYDDWGTMEFCPPNQMMIVRSIDGSLRVFQRRTEEETIVIDGEDIE